MAIFSYKRTVFSLLSEITYIRVSYTGLTPPQESRKVFSEGSHAEAFAEDLFLVFTNLLEQYSKQKAKGAESLQKGAKNRKRLRRSNLN